MTAEEDVQRLTEQRIEDTAVRVAAVEGALRNLSVEMTNIRVAQSEFHVKILEKIQETLTSVVNGVAQDAAIAKEHSDSTNKLLRDYKQRLETVESRTHNMSWKLGGILAGAPILASLVFVLLDKLL